jgi:hypothetical protein
MFFLVVDVGERLPVTVLDDEARGDTPAASFYVLT